MTQQNSDLFDNEQESLLPRFGSNFLNDHARLIISNPAIALVELVANAWDAGADRVDITWPDPELADIVIRDNGIGMTDSEFIQRWTELNYNRLATQGSAVVVRSRSDKPTRVAYGRNGKGRHSAFCFADEYTVETWRKGQANKFLVRKTSGIATRPFFIKQLSSYSTDQSASGTVINIPIARNPMKVAAVRDLIGSKFVVDPDFKVFLNGELVQLTDLSHILETRIVSILGFGDVQVHSIDSHRTGRTSKQHGVAWWVNKRLVGESSWRGFDEALLDARTSEAKRYTFVVEADLLAGSVSDDWNEFRNTASVKAVQKEVKKHVLERLREMMRVTHHERKVAALRANARNVRSLPTNAQNRVGQFVDELQTRLPGVDQKHLNATVNVISKLEYARSGYRLLEQLAKLDVHDIDTLSTILKDWSIQEAWEVLDELGWRLDLIKKMERFLENPSADELHDIQPLFENGLWIFGPEYDTIAFASNRTLKTVIEKFFNDTLKRPLINTRNRPDIVALPDTSIGIYSTESFDDRHEVDGIKSVLIIELKRGGFEINMDERYQALRYANELRKSGKVQDLTQITAFVLGTHVSMDARKEISEGNNTVIYPRSYSTVLQQAYARTFRISQRIKKLKESEAVLDPEVEEFLKTPEQIDMPSEEEEDS